MSPDAQCCTSNLTLRGRFCALAAKKVVTGNAEDDADEGTDRSEKERPKKSSKPSEIAG